MKLYSVSTAEGDVLIDSEDYPNLMAGLREGIGAGFYIPESYLETDQGIDLVNGYLKRFGVTLTVDNYDDEGQ